MRILIIAVLLLSIPIMAVAEEAEKLAELEKRVAALEAALKAALEGGADVEELQRQIDVLAKELEKARMGKAGKTRADLESVYGLGLAASKVYNVEQGISIGGYGEFLYVDPSAEQDNGVRSGDAAQADALRGVLYFGYKFNDKIIFNSEIEVEHASTDKEGSVSLEFATLDFLLKKPANIRAGLVLLPVGFINELHEPPIFLGARRPDVESKIIPTTWREVGAGIFGDAGPFSYRAYVVNGLDAEGFSSGSGIRGGRQKGSKAEAYDLGVTARVDFNGVPGLLIGGSFYNGDSGQGEENAAGEVIDGNVTLWEAHAEYRFRGLQVRGLWTDVDLDDADDISVLTGETIGSKMTGYYGEIGYDVLAPLGENTKQAVIPFFRYERYDTQDEVAAGYMTTGKNDVKLLTFGVNYKPIDRVVVKVDFQDYDRGDGSGTNQFNAGVGYLF